jgi:DNA-binding response OmpR family regulator
MRASNMIDPRGRTILLVDDNANFAAALARLLHMAGYGVQLAQDGAAAMEHLEAGAPDLMIVDLHLEGEDGLNVARALRERSGEAIPVLVLTGDSQIETLAGLGEAGTMTYLHKNVGSGVILRAVALAMGQGEKGNGLGG